jgi:hypothetical protein
LELQNCVQYLASRPPSQQCELDALLDASLDASHSHQYSPKSQLGAPASGASTRTSLDGHFRQFKVCRIAVSHESNSVSKLTQNAAASAAQDDLCLGMRE